MKTDKMDPTSQTSSTERAPSISQIKQYNPDGIESRDTRNYDSSNTSVENQRHIRTVGLLGIIDREPLS